MRRRAISLLWVLILVAAAVMFVVAGTTHGGRAAAQSCPILCPTTTKATTTTSTTSTTTTTTVAPTTTTTTAPPPTTNPSGGTGADPAALVPCSKTGAATCDQPPTKIQVRYPNGSPPAAVEVDWVADGRPSADPSPGSPSAALPWSAGSDCGSDLRCWSWPSAVTDHAAILNGTYRLVPCGGYTTGSPSGSCQSKLQATTVGLAVPPGPPTAVNAVASGPQVTLSWRPPASAPPDLAGYQVSRNGKAVYGCALSGLGPAGSASCPNPLTVVDRPGNGTYTYAVSAVRLGVDAASQHAVASAPALDAGGLVSVPGTASGPNRVGSPSPVIGAPGTMIDFGPPPAGASAPAVALPGENGSAADPNASPQNLQYPVADPLAGKSSTLALHVGETAPRPDVVPVGILGLGILVLAIAAHLVYLRSRVAAIQGGSARRAERSSG